MSSPPAYPPSSSPPPVMESRKRNIHNGQAYPSKKRSLPGNGKPLAPNLGPLGSSILFRKPAEIDKENLPPYEPLSPPMDVNGEFNGMNKTTFGPINSRKESVTNQKIQTAAQTVCAESYSPVKGSSSTLPQAQTSRGKAFRIRAKEKSNPISYERMIGERSTHAPNEAKRSFYGVDIHSLIDQAALIPQGSERSSPEIDASIDRPSVKTPLPEQNARRSRKLLWTEKYRARKFTDLVGDDRTHRDVLRWLKGWDSIVFPGSIKSKAKVNFHEEDQARPHRKILMLTGPPGLGKTTLAHVCARQAGYEVLEINASDERSRDVVKGRIKDCVGTENVRGVNSKTDKGNVRKTGRPSCIIVDEVDGVVSGSSGGEGGFIKALIDLIMLDQKNSSSVSNTHGSTVRAKKKRDNFRLLRPMILICNDVYHPALRPLRATTIAEVIHIRKPPLDKVVSRLGTVFEQEGVPHDKDGVRRLCEATWGLCNRRERSSQSSGTGEGDMRSILVVAEWVASKLRQTQGKSSRMTKKWIEENMLENLARGGAGARGIGSGGTKEAVQRVFQDGAGFAKSELLASSHASASSVERGDAQGVSQAAKRGAMQRLQEIIDASGESDRIITDCFAAYPSHQFQDDTFLSKPNTAYDWLHFHDRLSSRVHSGQEWELGPYLSQSALGLHHLFASPTNQFKSSDQRRWDEDAEEEPAPFSGPRADYEALEAMKRNQAILLSLQSSLAVPLTRLFRSVADIATDLLPNIIKMLTPDVKPVIVGGSGDQRGVVSVRKEGERAMIQRAVSVMSAVGVTFERNRVDASGQAGGVSTYIYRMEP